MSADHKAFQSDGHALVRGLASREAAASYRPVIGRVVAQYAGDAQGRIDDYYDATVTMWLALVDVDEEMGLMRFASGSHRARGDYASITDANVDAARWPLWTAPAMRAGDATFHAGGTLHSAGANRSDRVREILTVIYYAAGARAAQPANDNQRVDLEVFLPGVRPGDEAASALNPVLWPADCASPST